MSADGRPLPKVKLDRLLYTHYQHQNLESANKFFTDFGLHIVERRDNIILYRGFGASSYVYVAEQSPDHVSDAAGHGKFVELQDRNGVGLTIHHGLLLRSEEEQKEEIPAPVTINSWNDKPRKGEFHRFDTGPSKVHKLGHYGLVVDKSKFKDTVAWYLSTFGLTKTDSLYDEKSGEDMMTFMHIDKGEEFTDHHSLFIQSPPPPVPKSYPHHSSFEVDNMDSQLTGHYHLQGKRWTNCWGVGRHLLGSQITELDENNKRHPTSLQDELGLTLSTSDGITSDGWVHEQEFLIQLQKDQLETYRHQNLALRVFLTDRTRSPIRGRARQS
ncbi:hypothetical protein LTR93_012052 [Exophiala xenobiotica]|nr:hypothetical protein LTR93_012052 [Exophiala xenobiotica]